MGAGVQLPGSADLAETKISQSRSAAGLRSQSGRLLHGLLHTQD
jgi:hypothetical protein